MSNSAKLIQISLETFEIFLRQVEQVDRLEMTPLLYEFLYLCSSCQGSPFEEG
jgi:hypothetical protein